MASPSTRRTGFSRRAQYGLFLGYVLAVAGILFAILLLVIAAVDPRGFSALKGAALDVTTPVASGGRSVVGFFTGIGDSIGNYFMAGSQNADLKREVAQNRRKLIEAQATALENKRLKALLKVRDAEMDEVTTARIVGSSFDSLRRLGTLTAGSSEGVEVGQAVRGPDGLIGRVIERGRWASRVLLVTDTASRVPVRLVRDGTPAMAVGHGDGTIDLNTLEVGENPFRRGDILVTSGTGGLFPPGIPVALVVRAERERTVATPIADPGEIDFAMVLPIYQAGADEPLAEPGEPKAGPR
ncbi:MAG TPA: rod shape-determining protein MreC [Allosphingosinicella sp.]|nr:rod shape-determining protein MreC [Allosphingosinicella sp.]